MFWFIQITHMFLSKLNLLKYPAINQSHAHVFLQFVPYFVTTVLTI